MPILNQKSPVFDDECVLMFPVKQVPAELIHLLKEVQRENKYP